MSEAHAGLGAAGPDPRKQLTTTALAALPGRTLPHRRMHRFRQTAHHHHLLLRPKCQQSSHLHNFQTVLTHRRIHQFGQTVCHHHLLLHSKRQQISHPHGLHHHHPPLRPKRMHWFRHHRLSLRPRNRQNSSIRKVRPRQLLLRSKTRQSTVCHCPPQAHTVTPPSSRWAALRCQRRKQRRKGRKRQAMSGVRPIWRLPHHYSKMRRGPDSRSKCQLAQCLRATRLSALSCPRREQKRQKIRTARSESRKQPHRLQKVRRQPMLLHKKCRRSSAFHVLILPKCWKSCRHQGVSHHRPLLGRKRRQIRWREFRKPQQNPDCKPKLQNSIHREGSNKFLQKKLRQL
mmetsp:Transcript_136265/g.435988  ORF Transcript_136265/g.435988 Transcript_136265/m.435988 type:complete len:344 (+) Transcript_136265:3355-4386(+)